MDFVASSKATYPTGTKADSWLERMRMVGPTPGRVFSHYLGLFLDDLRHLLSSFLLRDTYATPTGEGPCRDVEFRTAQSLVVKSIHSILDPAFYPVC